MQPVSVALPNSSISSIGPVAAAQPFRSRLRVVLVVSSDSSLRERLYHSHIEHWRSQQERGTLPATTGKPSPKSAEADELALLRAENKRLKARTARLESDLGKTRTALDIAGKAFALLEDISGSADSGTS